MGPVVSESAMNGILNYIEVGKKEGKLVLGGGRAPAMVILSNPRLSLM